MTDSTDSDQAEDSRPEGGDDDDGEVEDSRPEGGDDDDGEAAREAPAGQEEKAAGDGGEPSPPQQLLDALGDEIEDVRRRAAEQDPLQRAEGGPPGAGLDEEQESFVQEGDADRDQPADDTSAPPG